MVKKKGANTMLEVTFHDPAQVPDGKLKYAVIAAQYEGKWVFCRHKERTTWEVPGGHREPGEDILATARRELWEETGALEAEIRPLCVYRVNDYGMLCYAKITKLGPLSPDSEIGEICLAGDLPEELTYPAIQPYLFRYVNEHL